MASPRQRLAGPGVFWINSGVTDEAVLPYKDFVRWYEEVHIPDVLHADPDQPLPAAWRYECAAAAPVPCPFLAVYKMPDLAFVGSPAFAKIPIHHESLPDGGPIGRFGTFRARFSRHVETWGGSEGGRAPILVSEAIEPAGDATDDLCSWYRGAYMDEVRQMPGWVRSTRFEVIVRSEIRGDAPPPPPVAAAAGPPPHLAPMWLTLHEFDGTGDVAQRLAQVSATALLGEAGATRQMERALVQVEVLPFHLVRSYGDAGAAFFDAGDKDN